MEVVVPRQMVVALLAVVVVAQADMGLLLIPVVSHLQIQALSLVEVVAQAAAAIMVPVKVVVVGSVFTLEVVQILIILE